MFNVIDTNSLAQHLKEVLDKAVDSDSGVVKFMSYQVHDEGGSRTLSSHIVTYRGGNLYLHAISYSRGVYSVTTFIGGKGKVTNKVSEDADSYLQKVYFAGNPNGKDLFYAYSAEEGYSFSNYTDNNKGALAVPSNFGLQCRNYYLAITQALSYMLRAKVSRLRMLGVKKYTFGNVLDSEGIKKEFSDAEVDVFVADVKDGIYTEISLEFRSKGTHYKLEYLPTYTSDGLHPLSIIVSRYSDNEDEDFSEVVPLDKSYKDVLISFMDYLHEVIGLIHSGRNTYSYGFNVDTMRRSGNSYSPL